MLEPETGRFEVVVEEGVPRGDLYELEQMIYHHVVDRWTGQTVLTFVGKLEASLSTEAGLWDGYHLSGVRGVCIAEDGRSALVRHGDGREERVPLTE
ncbi:MAG TPA: hypothetical protein PKO09_15650 [Anaerolineae bacterium]|nr:hypothetical protein [Anaerolineae bacterium]